MKPRNFVSSILSSFEVLERISRTYAGRPIYVLQTDGTVYGRLECEYLTIEQAVENMVERIKCKGATNG